MRLDPTSLALFVCVVEEGTIVGAAEREHIAPAAVSKRMSDLEGVLRAQLLSRTKKGVEPTAAGVALLSLARVVLNNLDEISVRMRDYASGTRGRVRVSANISAITQFLPTEIASFLAAHPEVEIHLEERISTLVTKAVAENAADIGIFTFIPHGYHLDIFPYHADTLSLIAPNAHPLARKRSVSFLETLEFDYVGLHTGSAINLQLTKAAADLNMPLKLRIQVTGYDALCLMVHAGLGIAVLPKLVAKRYVDTLRIRALVLDELWAKRQLKICVRSYNALPAAAKLLVDHLRTAV